MLELLQILMTENRRHKALIGQQNYLIGQLLKNEWNALKGMAQNFLQNVKEGKDTNKTH